MELFLRKRQLRVLRTLARWKVLDVRELQMEMGDQSHYTTFFKFIKKLERMNVIQSIIGQDGKKILCLTKAGLNEINEENKSLIDTTHLRHDLITGRMARQFIKANWVNNVFFAHEIKSSSDLNSLASIDPDAIMSGKLKQGNDFVSGLEVELNRKSVSRILPKLRNYLQSKYYTLCIYAFEFQADFASYVYIFKDWLNSLSQDEREAACDKFLFFFHPRIDTPDESLKNSRCWFRGHEGNLGGVFCS